MNIKKKKNLISQQPIEVFLRKTSFVIYCVKYWNVNYTKVADEQENQRLQPNQDSHDANEVTRIVSSNNKQLIACSELLVKVKYWVAMRRGMPHTQIHTRKNTLKHKQ